MSAPIAGWDELVEALRVLPETALAKLPERLRGDRQTQQELGRRALASLAYAILETVGGDGDYPVWLPGTGQVLNIGQPNADSLYKMASLTPGGTYRIRGRLGNTRLATIGPMCPAVKLALKLSPVSTASPSTPVAWVRPLI